MAVGWLHIGALLLVGLLAVYIIYPCAVKRWRRPEAHMYEDLMQEEEEERKGSAAGVMQLAVHEFQKCGSVMHGLARTVRTALAAVGSTVAEHTLGLFVIAICGGAATLQYTLYHFIIVMFSLLLLK